MTREEEMWKAAKEAISDCSCEECQTKRFMFSKGWKAADAHPKKGEPKEGWYISANDHRPHRYRDSSPGDTWQENLDGSPETCTIKTGDRLKLATGGDGTAMHTYRDPVVNEVWVKRDDRDGCVTYVREQITLIERPEAKA